MLLAETRRRGSEVRYGTELCSFEQDDAGVTAVLRDRESGESETVRADYLVAADGVHSPISGIGSASPRRATARCRSIVVFIYFRAPWRKFVAAPGRGGRRADQKC